MLRKRWNTDFDDAQAIGRRYRRQDEIGTPFCVTVDFDTLEDQAVTVRDRDSMTQERIGVDALAGYLSDRLPLWCAGFHLRQGGHDRVQGLRCRGRGLAAGGTSALEARSKTSAAASWKPSGRPAALMEAAISSISPIQRQPFAAAAAAERSDWAVRPAETAATRPAASARRRPPGEGAGREQQGRAALRPGRVGHLDR